MNAPIVTAEHATVYRVHGRRYFSRAAAYRGAAKAIVRAACECERAEPDVGFYGSACRFHDAALIDARGRIYGDRVIARMARRLKWRDGAR